VLLGLVDVLVLKLLAQLALLGDQFVDAAQNVVVLVHPFSLPDYG
jgi:hypothetical protein